VFREGLIFRVVVPSLGSGLRGKLKYYYATGPGLGAFQVFDIVVIGDEGATVFFQQWEKSFLIL
jgi:hypothetical protein